METALKIYEEARRLPEFLAKEVLDFIGYIEIKHGLKDLMTDELIKSQEPVMNDVWANDEDEVWNDL
jgi:hypothetical protein